MELTGEPEKQAEPRHPFSNLSEGRDEWLTPPEIITALGLFDLDPCAPIESVRPWATAARHYSRLDNGLRKEWSGRVWLNPPYGAETGKWLGRLAEHGNGTALIFARTETEMFFRHVWPVAKAIVFIEGRLNFYNVNGKRAPMNAGAPSCLIAYGELDAFALKKATHNNAIKGRYIEL